MAAGSINQIKKAFPACFAINGFSTCANKEINDTLKQQPGADIDFKSTANKKACWSVEVKGAVDDEGGTQCVDFDSTGALINYFKDGTASKHGTCTAAGVYS